MSALEYQFPDPADAPAGYLEVAINSFNNIVNRWDDTSCGGGLKWQIYPENAYGFNYKNSISNGCAFALGARLARYTGEQKYADWASKIYDWTKKVGLITDQFEVYDGSDDKTNCAAVSDKTQWTYNNAMFLHGSAFMYDFTNGDSTWKDRTSGFLKHAETLFFQPTEQISNIMYESACETGETGRHCNLDQQSFKAYLSRFMAKTAILAPFTKDTVTKLLKASAVGAAKSCSGGQDGATCGSKWYTGNWDGTSGVGQQLSALEVTQALLMLQKGTVPVKKGGSQPAPSVSAAPKPSSTPVVTPTPSQSSKADTPAPSSKVNTPPLSSAALISSKAATLAPAPSSFQAPQQPVSSVNIVPAPSASTKPGGEFQEKPSSTSCTPSIKTVYVAPSTSCTPSVTTTIYVSASTPVAPPAVPIVTASQPPVAPPVNSTLPRPSPSAPLEFTGAGSTMTTTVGTVFGSLIVALMAGVL